MVLKAFMRLRCRLLGKQIAPEKEGNTEATDNEDHEPIENVKIYHKDFHIWLMIHCVQKVIMNTTNLYALILFDMGGGGMMTPQIVFDHCAQTLRRRKLKLGDF